MSHNFGEHSGVSIERTQQILGEIARILNERGRDCDCAMVNVLTEVTQDPKEIGVAAFALGRISLEVEMENKAQAMLKIVEDAEREQKWNDSLTNKNKMIN